MIFTARIRSLRECNIFSPVSLSTLGGSHVITTHDAISQTCSNLLTRDPTTTTREPLPPPWTCSNLFT